MDFLKKQKNPPQLAEDRTTFEKSVFSSLVKLFQQRVDILRISKAVR